MTKKKKQQKSTDRRHTAHTYTRIILVKQMNHEPIYESKTKNLLAIGMPIEELINRFFEKKNKAFHIGFGNW